MSCQENSNAQPEEVSKNFIRRIIEEDIQQGKNQGKVVTRFPPEPNGFLHIGHAKSICLNFGIADDFNSVCHLRFDDTDPTKEDTIYENSIQQDVRWLGFDWQGKLFHASDYFEKMYEYAVQLIKDRKAYVCSLTEDEIRQYRGTVTVPGTISPHASRSVEENLDLFQRMRNGEFSDSAHVLRARIDMTSPNMKMRDPLLYRIRHAHHYMTGDKWCIYPMYDYAHPISDAIEGITHSICTLEFENNRELYDWVLDNIQAKFPSRPHQYEFARLDLTHAVMSKRKLLQLVENKIVNGWDDPRLSTISGLRRRGCTPESIRKFCELVGVAKANSTVDVSLLEFCLRDDLNTKAPRVMAVLKPLKVIIDNYPENKTEEFDAPYWPHDIAKEGSRKLPFSKEIYIEQDDFMENPPADFHRLAIGKEVRLRHAYCITCTSVDKDSSGKIIAIHCTYDPATKGEAPQGRKIKGTIHWVPSTAFSADVRLYSHLLKEEGDETEKDFLKNFNPDSLQIITNCLLEPSLKEAMGGERFQFERQGYFYVDPIDSKPNQPRFNRIVTLKDSWTKKTAEVPIKPVKNTPEKKPSSAVNERPALPQLTNEQLERSKHYQQHLQLTEEEAHLIAQSDATSAFFEECLNTHSSPKSTANWINNELLRELKNTPIDALPFGSKEFALLVKLVDNAVISGKTAKDVFGLMMANGGHPEDIVMKAGLQQISDPKILENMIDHIFVSQKESVESYRQGNERLFGFFVGLVMKESKGRANPELVNKLLLTKLKVESK